VTNLLDDVFAVFVSGETRLWSETICARWPRPPRHLRRVEPATLAKALKPHGVETEQMELLDPTTRTVRSAATSRASPERPPAGPHDR